MSQKAVFIKVNDELVQEVFHNVPDYDEMCQICADIDYDGMGQCSECYTVEYEWIDIGEGESGMDDFIDDATLLSLYDNPDYQKVISEKFELDIEIIDCGSVEIPIEDVMKE